MQSPTIYYNVKKKHQIPHDIHCEFEVIFNRQPTYNKRKTVKTVAMKLPYIISYDVICVFHRPAFHCSRHVLNISLFSDLELPFVSYG